MANRGIHEHPWPDADIERLRELWAESLSTAEIGRRMHLTKNQVIGKARRLNLLARPSPIHAADTPQPARPPRAPKVTLAPLRARTSGHKFQHRTTAEALNGIAGRDLDREEVGAEEVLPVGEMWRALRESPVVHRNRSTECCYPIGEPRTSGFRFCEAVPASGKPYCAAHAQVCYVPYVQKQAEAVA